MGNFYSLLFRHPVYEADQGKTINMEDSVSAGVCHESEEVPLIIFWVAQCPDTIIMQSEKKVMKKTAATTDRVTLVAVFVCQSLCHSAGWRTALI